MNTEMNNYYTKNHGNYSWRYHGLNNALNRTSYLLTNPLDHWATKHLRGGSHKLTKVSLVAKAVLIPLILGGFVIASFIL